MADQEPENRIQIADDGVPSLEDVVQKLKEMGAPEIMLAVGKDTISVDDAFDSLRAMDALQSGPNKSRSRSDLLSAVLMRHGDPGEEIARKLYACLHAKKYIPQEQWVNPPKGRAYKEITLVEVEDMATQSWAIDTMCRILGYYHKEPKETAPKYNIKMQIMQEVRDTPTEKLLEEGKAAARILKEVNIEDAEFDETDD